MSIRDLPGILRLIARADAASIVVVHGDDVVTFNLSDLDATSALTFKSILHRVYLNRGHAAVLARQTRRERRWNGCKRVWIGWAASLHTFKSWLAVSWVRLSARVSSFFLAG